MTRILKICALLVAGLLFFLPAAAQDDSVRIDDQLRNIYLQHTGYSDEAEQAWEAHAGKVLSEHLDTLHLQSSKIENGFYARRADQFLIEALSQKADTSFAELSYIALDGLMSGDTGFVAVDQSPPGEYFTRHSLVRNIHSRNADETVKSDPAPHTEISSAAASFVVLKSRQLMGLEYWDPTIIPTLRNRLSAPTTRLVLDLRGNEGGLLVSITEIASLVSPPGVPIIGIESSMSDTDIYKTSESKHSLNAERNGIIILIDDDTAAGALALAAALRNKRNALIIGDHGRKNIDHGQIRKVTPVPDCLAGYANCLLFLPTARMVLPDGTYIENALEIDHPIIWADPDAETRLQSILSSVTE